MQQENKVFYNWNKMCLKKSCFLIDKKYLKNLGKNMTIVVIVGKGAVIFKENQNFYI